MSHKILIPKAEASMPHSILASPPRSQQLPAIFFAVLTILFDVLSVLCNNTNIILI
jgi:hypothetical protein